MFLFIPLVKKTLFRIVYMISLVLNDNKISDMKGKVFKSKRNISYGNEWLNTILYTAATSHYVVNLHFYTIFVCIIQKWRKSCLCLPTLATCSHRVYFFHSFYTSYPILKNIPASFMLYNVLIPI